MVTPTNRRSYYPALDGLRGVAVVLVLLHHNFDFIHFLQYGWIGVDLFFVLSGFLITEILVETINQPNFLRNFYMKRVLRIFPLYYLVILLFLIVGSHLSELAGQYNYYHRYQVFLWTNTQNWLYILHQPPGDQFVLSPFWSLSVEEQFYLCWPLVLLLVRNCKQLATMLIVLLVVGVATRVASWIILGNGYTNFTFQEWTRMDGLYLGCLIALWKHYYPSLLQKRLVKICLVIFCVHLIAAICIKITHSTVPHFYIIGYSSIAALFALLVYYGIAGTGPVKKYLLENRALKWLGKISYGLYVYHYPVLVLFKLYLTTGVMSLGFSNLEAYIFLSISAAIVAIGISWLSYTFFETKILSLKRRFE